FWTLTWVEEGTDSVLFTRPQPPPPGVSMRTRSPRRRRVLPLLGMRSVEPSARSISVRPGAPSSPLARPYGRDLRRSASNVTVVWGTRRLLDRQASSGVPRAWAASMRDDTSLSARAIGINIHCPSRDTIRLFGAAIAPPP